LLISYNSQLLQEICYQTSVAVKYFGEGITHDLQARHSDILAAKNVYGLPLGKVIVNENECTLKFSETLSLQLSPNYGIAAESGHFDWATVRRVKIMRINDVE